MSNFSLNKVILAGRFTENPAEKLHTSAGNRKSLMFRLALNKVWVKDGVRHSAATFITCKSFDTNAENIARFFTKGRLIYIEGELKNDEWDKEDGTRGRETRVYVNNWQFVDGRQGEEDGSSNAATISSNSSSVNSSYSDSSDYDCIF